MRFSKKTLDFLSLAGRQKDHAWLEKHEGQYQKYVKGPFVEFARELERRLANEARGHHFPTKGIGRIKRPAHKVGRGEPVNKNFLSISISKPTGSRFEQNPHLFFGMLPDGPEWNGVVISGGLYFPNASQVRAVREAIAYDSTPFKKLFKDRSFTARFKNGFDDGQVATRVPKGFDPQSKDLEWLKLKRFMVLKEIPLKTFSSTRFVDEVVLDFRQALRLNELLERAIRRDWIF